MIRKTALNWNDSYTVLAADALCRNCPAGQPADFSDTLILVPTAEAGRLLREELARRFIMEGGVTGLNIELPDSMLFAGAELAGEAQILQGWIDTFYDNRNYVCALLRKDSLENETYAGFYAGVAREVQNLRTILAADGLSLNDVLDRLENIEGVMRYEEQERFRALAQLEKEYLARIDRKDPVAAKLEAMHHPLKHRKINVIGCSELKLAVLNALELSSDDINIMIFAPEEELEHFDRWGRPDIDYWQNRWQIRFDWQSNLRRLSTPAEQGRAVLKVTESVKPQVIGVLDAEVRDFIMNRNPEFFAPGCEALSLQPCTALFLQLMELAEENVRYESVGDLARNSFICSYLYSIDPEWDWRDCMAGLDKLQKEHIISSLEELHKIDDGVFSRTLYDWHVNLQNSPAAVKTLWEIFTGVVRCAAAEINSAELKLLRDMTESVLGLKTDSNTSQMLLLRDILTHMRMPEEGNLTGRPEIAGFLELPWYNEKALVLAGMNEDNFAYPAESGIFLPGKLRELLGMSPAELNYAADVVRFQSLLSRGGDVALFFGRTSQGGDALSPARILLQCSGNELYTRASAIFSGQLDLSMPFNDPVEPERKLIVPAKTKPGSNMPVTGFAQYLKCPFRFYYERVCRARELEDRNLELDPLEFGTAAHAVLERFGRECRGKNSSEIALFTLNAMEEIFRKRILGGDFGVVELQKEILRNNLNAFAGVQAKLFEEGWEIKAAEESIAINWDELYRSYFPDCEEWRKRITIVGKLDRLDCRNDLSGHGRIWRVVDYKTGNKGDSPRSKHWGGAGALWTDDPEEAEKRTVPGEKKYWIDLQLPLYEMIVRYLLSQRGELGPDDRIECGYFNLPVAYAFTGVELFRELEDEEIFKSAVVCADYVLRRIFVEQIFWPPKSEKDIFDPLRARIGVYRAEDMIQPGGGDC